MQNIEHDKRRNIRSGTVQAPESRNRRHAGDHVRNNLLPSIGATVFCIILAPVYYRFSHGVHSPWMTFLFLWPLVLGVLPALLLMRMSARALPGTAARILYGTGVEALTFGSLLRGILGLVPRTRRHCFISHHDCFRQKFCEKFCKRF